MGKALIASDVGGHKELISDGETGMLFPAGNSAALASTIEKLLSNNELRLAISRKGCDWVRDKRTWEKTTANYVDIYEKLLKKTPLN